MNRQILVCLLVFFVSGAGGAWGGTICPNMERQLNAPASEVAEIISGWFAAQGHVVRRDFPRPGIVHLTAWRAENEWDVTIRPQSALASVATIIHEGDINPIRACRRLQEYLDGYLLGAAPRPPQRDQRGRQLVPTVVLDRIETVVCIRTRSRGRDVQFSGFVVDPGGLVLCTAHDLYQYQKVTGTFTEAVSVPGTIARLDLDRDLALVECPASARAFVSLSSGRNLLGMGEHVFAIGCPNDLRGTLSPGTINGPPRLVNDQPLWQVEMNIYPGSSGSPVFDAQGQLVALVKGRYRGTSTVGFLTPLETIIAFLLNDTDG